MDEWAELEGWKMGYWKEVRGCVLLMEGQLKVGSLVGLAPTISTVNKAHSQPRSRSTILGPLTHIVPWKYSNDVPGAGSLIVSGDSRFTYKLLRQIAGHCIGYWSYHSLQSDIS